MTAPLPTPLQALRTLVDALQPPVTDAQLQPALATAQRVLEANEPTDWTPDAVRALRQRLGLTQITAAVELGVSVDALRDWEQGKRKPSAKYQERLDELNERNR